MNFQSAFVVLSTIVAVPAFAQDTKTNPLTYEANIALTSRLDTSDSLSHAENEVELSVFLGLNGWYTGLTLTSLYQNPADDYEYEFNLGYGSEFANGVTWDLQYGLIGLNESSGTNEELTAAFGMSASPRTTLALAVILDPETGKSDQEFGFETVLTDQWAVFGLVGNSDRDDNFYGELGASYAVTDAVSFEVLYEDTNDGNGLLGFTVSYAFGS